FSSISSQPCAAGLRRRRLKASPLHVDRLPNGQSGCAKIRRSHLFRVNFPRRITLSFALLLMENLLCSEWIQEPPLAPSMSVVSGTTASIQFPAPPSYRRN